MGNFCSSSLSPENYPPIPRYMRLAKNVDPTIIPKVDPNNIIHVMSYNVLADGLARTDWFTYANEKELDFNFRAPRVLQEIANSGASIVFFQELNRIEDYYESRLKELGYELVRFKQTETNIFF